MATQERPTNIGKYEILATLGRGGMGVVYKARDPVIDRIVAIKTILVGGQIDEDENLADRLTMEARSAGRLHHPNIVTVFDFGKEGDLSYIVMEYVEGINLAKLIDDHRPLPLDTKLSLLVQIANGLAYAHERGVIHRDMKPSNVCVASPGTAKILDFGLARFDNTKLTKTGYMAGTLAYMSPERLSGTTGAKDDIFALGAVAYELLTYERAFPGGTPPEVISKIIAPDPPRAPSQVAGVPEALDAVILKALAKDADARYATASDFADALRRIINSDAVHDLSPNAPTLQKPVDQDFIDARPSGNAYGIPSRKTATSSNQPTAIVADVSTKGASTKPDLQMTEAVAAPTVIAPTEKPRRQAMSLIAVAAVVIIGIATAILLMRRPEVPKNGGQPPPKPRVVTVTAKGPDAAVEESELQLATAHNLSDELARRKLNSAETFGLSQAKARIAMAEQKIKSKDYQSGVRLAADAVAGLQQLINSNDQRNQVVPAILPKTQPAARRTTVPVVTAAAPPPVSQPQAQPKVVEAAPAPVQQPRVETPPPASPAPLRESPEKEISTFMQQLAFAYQSRDIAFFREHWVHFSDQVASAVQKSPSVRVELQIQHIDFRDAQHASVSVKRTDWFPDSAIPPATQALFYHLERGPGGWQVASISR